MGKILDIIKKGMEKEKKRSRRGRLCLTCGHFNHNSEKGFSCNNCGSTLK